MKRGSSRSAKVLFDEGPSPENQPPHSPASSSNTPPNPNAQLSKDILRIYLTQFVEGGDVPETRVTRPNPNNGGYQFTTPPRVNRSRRHSGPHMSPTAHLPTNSLNISGESNTDYESTAHFSGNRTLESCADSFIGVVPSSVVEIGTSTASPQAKPLKPKKEKYPGYESF
ncbi:hypothetical protein RchiOBHm_Chr2g0111781 [Rosa chinensis]|uniref:Uncharacterized protein n=1 Tax=Rosa chinensis TaxID=74649 RepID=A0A2P6RQ19_ROSCH|nr:hypothetical protein RchiOBHm_Chr2g0111781 [Rosa chinensis]